MIFRKQKITITKTQFLIMTFLSLFMLAVILFYVRYTLGSGKVAAEIMGLFFLAFLLLNIVVMYRAPVHQVYLFLAILIGGLFFIAIPAGMVSDEYHHFFRAFAISQGHLIASQIDDTGAGGNYLPANLLPYSADAASYAECFRSLSSEMDKGNLVAYTFTNTALYSPVNYLPQLMGILIANLFTAKPLVLIYCGRFTNFIVCTALVYFAIKKIPVGKILIFAVAFMPMFVQEAVSLSPDGFTNSLSLCLVAYTVSLCCGEGKVRRADSVVLLILCLLLSFCKIVYLPICFIILMIPADQFVSIRRFVYQKAAILAGCVLCNFSGLLISTRYNLSTLKADSEVNGAEQIRTILFHPLFYIQVIVSTVIHETGDWLSTMIGSDLGWTNICIASFTYVLYGILMLGLLFSQRRPQLKKQQFLKPRDLILIGLIVLAAFGLIMTSLYIQWTAVGAGTVSGMQGRYLIPLLPFIGILFTGIPYSGSDREAVTESGEVQGLDADTVAYYFVLLLDCLAIVEIVAFYLSV